jgi:hypothetical protein
METGEQAVKRLQELDKNTGIVDPYTKRKAEAEFKRSQQAPEPTVPAIQAPIDGALDNKTIAINMLAQAKRMEIEAKSMISEAARMKKDAQRMHPSVKMERDTPAPAAPATPEISKVSTKRGRPSKALATNAVQ